MAPKKPAKQTKIPGTERTAHKEIEEKGEELYDVRTRRMELTKQEKQLGDELLVLLKAKGLTFHRINDLTMEIVAKDERVRVKKDGAGGEE